MPLPGPFIRLPLQVGTNNRPGSNRKAGYNPMHHEIVLYFIAGLALAITLGGMTFFSVVVAPLVFIKLPPDTAGRLIRQLFPWYYLTMGFTSLVALLAMAPEIVSGFTREAVMIALVVSGFVVARQLLMPAINRARDAELAGVAGAGQRFSRLHTASVLLNGCQWILVLLTFLFYLA
jgi:hypothetical protein